MIKQLRKAWAKQKPLQGEFKLSSSFANKRLLSSQNLYIENSCVRRSVSVVANAVASIKFKIFKNGKYINDHVLYSLLNRPNGIDSWATFIECLITNFMIYGNAYVILIENKKLELHNLHSENVSIIPGSFGIPKAYEYLVDSQKIEFDNSVECLPAVGHLKNVNPYDNWYGLSPLESIKMAANLHQSITEHNLSMIQNGGRLSGVVAFKSGAMPLTQEEKDKITNQLVTQYQGPGNAGRIAFVEGGEFEWKPMGANPKDMDYVWTKNLAAREISEALGVPSILIGGIGLSGESTRTNFKEVIDRFHEGTVLPLAEKLFSFLNNWLINKVDKNCCLQMDLDNFLPVHEKRYELWDKVNCATFLSDKEKRILLGLENIESQAEAERTGY